MNDSKIVQKILRTLTDKYTYVVVSIEESQDIEAMTVDELQNSLSTHEQKFTRKSREEGGVEQVLKVEGRYGERSSRGGGTFRGRGRSGGRQYTNKATVECFKCHNLGHFQYECPRWNKEAHYAELEDEDDFLLMARIEEEESKKCVWYIDSGCNNHMCKDESMFTSLDKTFSHSVKLGNNDNLQVTGRGNVKMQVKDTTYTITDVYFVPTLKSNLLSVGQFQDKGLAILFKEGTCYVYHPRRGEIIRSVMATNRMFTITLECNTERVQSGECLQATSNELSMLWHQRYGHLNFKGLKTLHDKKMVIGLPELKGEAIVCTDCLNGKQTRNPIPKQSNWREVAVLELIHSDLCGPISPTSNSGKRYFLCFIDDFSTKGWAYLLANKSDTLYHFKIFKALVEKESGKNIKCLRTDRGGEYLSSDFNAYCNEHGIKRQLTNPYTPQQNGVAERRNRTVMNMVRAMLSAKNMPKTLWPEAVNWTFYILNRCPTLAVKDMTPQEAWNGVKPSVIDLKIWGCLVHAHVPNVHRSKLDNRSSMCIFLGVSHETKGYRRQKLGLGKDYESQVSTTLVWEDAEIGTTIEQQQNNVDQEAAADQPGEMDQKTVDDENTEIEDNDTDAATPEQQPQSSQGRDNTTQRRIQRTPRWMQDYVSGEDISEDEAVGNQ
ncbi:hypothetical protein LIER_12323 [Lithospermum erythrorhizon]|uniref:Polyprotein n=1 Tax=Lithospermum erythrorhizon TaxID=34254 RepID=A0AAV3PSN5_LITER